MFCENCGKELMDNSAFCPNCGKSVNSDIIDNNMNNQMNNNAYSNVQGGYNYNNIMPYNVNPYGYQQQPYQQTIQQPYVPQQSYVAPQPTVVNVQAVPPVEMKSSNGLCIASFAISIAGLFVGALVCGIASIVFAIVGIGSYDENRHTGKWMAFTGLVIGILDLIVGIYLVSVYATLFSNLFSYI